MNFTCVGIFEGGGKWRGSSIQKQGDTSTCPTGSESNGLETTTKNSFLQKAPGEVVLSNDSRLSGRFYKKMKRTVIEYVGWVCGSWLMRSWVPRTPVEKVEAVRLVNNFWSVTCLSSYLCFLLQYTKRLSKRKNTRSWIFPEEIFSKTPHISISVQVSVMLDP